MLDKKNNEEIPEIQPINCEDRGIDVKWKDKIIIISEEDSLRDDFREPKSFYYRNAFNDYVFLRTNRLNKAQEMVDEITGKKGWYKACIVVKASVR